MNRLHDIIHRENKITTTIYPRIIRDKFIFRKSTNNKSMISWSAISVIGILEDFTVSENQNWVAGRDIIFNNNRRRIIQNTNLPIKLKIILDQLFYFIAINTALPTQLFFPINHFDYLIFRK